MTVEATLPTERTAKRIFAAHFAEPVSRVTRFPKGICHYVYEVVTTYDQAYVVRISTPTTGSQLEAGAVHPRRWDLMLTYWLVNVQLYS